MHRALLITPLLLAAACHPQNAELSAGDFTAFLSAAGSQTAARDKLDPDDFERTYAVDCRTFNGEEGEELEGLRLDNRLQICTGDEGVGEDDWPLTHEKWLERDGYEVFGDPLDAFRGEAIVTTEGDLQLTFHHRLSAQESFRFHVVVDPDFQPRECRQVDDEGNVEYVQIDGDWIQNWSEDTGDDSTMFYLNAASYQFNPDQEILSTQGSPDRTWFLPNEWQAGYAHAWFGDDQLRLRPARYATPAAYFSFEAEQADFFGEASLTVGDLYYWDAYNTYLFEAAVRGDETPPGSGFCGTAEECTQLQAERAEWDSEGVVDEYALVGLPVDDESLPTMAPLVHSNAWREVDSFAAGMDGWTELHHNWIKFDAGSGFEVGDSASGEFALVFDAFDSRSTVFVRGTFDIDKIKRDTWGTDYLPAEKFEENDTVLCGERITPQ